MLNVLFIIIISMLTFAAFAPILLPLLLLMNSLIHLEETIFIKIIIYLLMIFIIVLFIFPFVYDYLDTLELSF